MATIPFGQCFAKPCQRGRETCACSLYKIHTFQRSCYSAGKEFEADVMLAPKFFSRTRMQSMLIERAIQYTNAFTRKDPPRCTVYDMMFSTCAISLSR